MKKCIINDFTCSQYYKGECTLMNPQFECDDYMVFLEEWDEEAKYYEDEEEEH